MVRNLEFMNNSAIFDDKNLYRNWWTRWV